MPAADMLPNQLVQVARANLATAGCETELENISQP